MACAIPDPLPSNLSGTYFARIPERANLDLVRAMVRTYMFDDHICTGVRYNTSDGWARYVKLTMNSYYHIRHVPTKIRIRIQCDYETYEHRGEPMFAIQYIISIKRTGQSCKPDSTAILITYENYKPTSYLCRGATQYKYADIACLIMPTGPAPYHEHERPIAIGKYTGYISRGPGGVLERLRLNYVTNIANSYIIIVRKFVPYNPLHMRYKWQHTGQRGTLTYNIATAAVDVKCKTSADPEIAAKITLWFNIAE